MQSPIPSPPPRPVEAHKGTFGTVIVVGGCATMIGAPAICARAALRTGVGLVKAACPAEVLPHVLTIEPSATGIALGGDLGDALAQIDLADPDKKAVLAVGPGLGQDAERGELVIALLAGERPVVLDADGLNLLAKHLQKQGADAFSGSRPPSPRVLTPHPGEYRRLAAALGIDADPTGSDAERGRAATLVSQRLGCVVLLKGKRTVIADGARTAFNTTGNPALATAGSGDVLTGVIASLLAQGMTPFDAARLAAHAHGLAADQWADQHGTRGLRAMELADRLPAALAELA